MYKYSGIIKEDFNNGEGVGVTIFLQGCLHHCPHCQNPQTWDFNGGKEFTDDILKDIINYISEHIYIKRLTLSGGDPLYNLKLSELIILEAKKVRPDLKIWVYTGFIYDYLIEHEEYNNILKLIDILIDGEYKEELRDISLAFRGSSNQRIINVKESLLTNKIILYKINN